jgi:hypothetical protein
VLLSAVTAQRYGVSEHAAKRTDSVACVNTNALQQRCDVPQDYTGVPNDSNTISGSSSYSCGTV